MAVSAEQLMRGTTQVSSLPSLYRRLDEAIDAPNSSFAHIGKIVADDTGFTARLLRIANSALYNFPSKIETVERAMSIIGTKQLRELALATTVVRMFKGMENSLVSMESFWRHSICCGAAARVIATARRENNIERFFVLGMLHDIGRLVMYNRIPEVCAGIIDEAQRDRRLLFEVEKEQLGFNHADIGRLLLQMWKLPKAQIEAVGYHHAPHVAQHYPMEAAVLHIADVIANALQWGTSGEGFVPRFNAEAWQRLELTERHLEAIVAHTDEQTGEAIRLFLDDEE
ncbi:HDOD domain-containing protein [Endothiovibrio diazotrophicus]